MRYVQTTIQDILHQDSAVPLSLLSHTDSKDIFQLLALDWTGFSDPLDWAILLQNNSRSITNTTKYRLPTSQPINQTLQSIAYPPPNQSIKHYKVSPTHLPTNRSNTTKYRLPTSQPIDQTLQSIAYPPPNQSIKHYKVSPTHLPTNRSNTTKYRLPTSQPIDQTLQSIAYPPPNQSIKLYTPAEPTSKGELISA